MLLLQINNNLRHLDEMSWNHVSMCILNGGGIRSPIDERNNGMLLRLPVLSSVSSLWPCTWAASADLCCQLWTTVSVPSVWVSHYSSQHLAQRTHTHMLRFSCVSAHSSSRLRLMEPKLDLNFWLTKLNRNCCWFMQNIDSLHPDLWKERGKIVFCTGKHTTGLNPLRAFTDTQGYVIWWNKPTRQILKMFLLSSLIRCQNQPVCVSPTLTSLFQSGTGGREMLPVWRTWPMLSTHWRSWLMPGDPGQSTGNFRVTAIYKSCLSCSVVEGTGRGLLESVHSWSAGRQLDTADADPVASQGPVPPSPPPPLSHPKENWFGRQLVLKIFFF